MTHAEVTIQAGSANAVSIDAETHEVSIVSQAIGIVEDHALNHISGGSDEVDGDRLDIDWDPTNYTPTTSPTEVTSLDHLTAHLAGIDTELAGMGSGDVTKVGTPVDNQIGVWTGDGTIEGDAALTFDTSTDTFAVGASGNINFGAVTILADSAGTTTLQNIDAIDATTEATIEAAIDTLANLTSAASLATIGTITTGVWNGTDIAVADGGTGRGTATAYAVICGGTTATGAHQSIASVGSSGQVLTSNGAGALPTFQAAPSGSEWTLNTNDLSPNTSATTNVVVGGTTQANSDIVLNADGSAVFNEQGAAVNFRVEGDTNANLLVVDGTNNRVGIGTNPLETLNVLGTVRLQGTGLVGGSVLVNVVSNAITGNLDAFKVGISTTGDLNFLCQQNGAGNARFVNRVLGAGDPYTLYEISGGQQFSEGIDNSDGDNYKVSASSVVGTNDRFVIDATSGETTITNAGTALIAQNTTDSAAEQVAILRGPDRATPSDGQDIYLSVELEDDAPGFSEFCRLTFQANDVTNTSKDAEIRFGVQVANTLTDQVTISQQGLEVDSALRINEGLYETITKIDNTDSPYTVLSTDTTIIADTSAGNITINLQAISGQDGRVLQIKHIAASNTTTIDGNASETIDGSTTIALSTQYESVILKGDSTAGEWWIF